MSNDNKYDVAVAGGGLAGLAIAILLGKKDIKQYYLKKKFILFIRFAENISALNHGIFYYPWVCR